MNQNKEMIIKNAIAVITAFILTFALSCLNICLAGKIISQPFFVKKVVVGSNYVSNAASEIKEALSDLAIPSGLPSDFFDKKVSDSKVSQLVASALDYNFKISSKAPDFSFIKEDLSKDINAFANEHFVTIDNETKKAITALTEECYNVYLRYCNPQVIQVLGQVVGSVSKIITLGIIASLLLSGVTLVFLFRLVDRKNFLFYSFVSFLGAGLLSGIIPLILLVTNKISHIAILSKSLYAFLCSFANSGLFIVVLFSLLFVLISLLMLFFELRKK